MREVWVDVAGYEGFYEVSNFGQVRRAFDAQSASGTHAGKILKPSPTHGYLHVSLSTGGMTESHRLHVLVMRSFCGERPFDGAQVCHNDGDKHNCKLTNLRWDTAQGNQADVERHGNRRKGSTVFGAKLTEDSVAEIRSRLRVGEKGIDLADDYNVSPSTISLIALNKIWRHVNV